MEKNVPSLKYVIVIALIPLAVACHKKPPTATAPISEVSPPPPPAPTCTLTGEPASVSQGQSTTLSWTSKDATEVDLQPGLGKQLAQGSTSVTPQESTTYSLTATGPGGTANCIARVTVVSPPLPPTPSVQEENIRETSGTSGAEIKDAYFDLDKYDLRLDAQQALTADASFLKARPEIKFTIEGHCDQRGSEEYNFGLGDLRATAAKSYLANLGIAASRMSTVSYGKDRPVCAEATEECWQKNRRAHLRLQGIGER